MSMSKALSNKLILVLSCIGCLITLVLLFEHFRPAVDIGCSALSGNCRAANESDYGHVGPIPTSAFGLGMYLTLIALCLKRKSLLDAYADAPVEDDPISRLEDDGAPLNDFTPVIQPITVRSINCPERRIDLLVWLIALPAIAISIWLQKVALFDIFSFCPWCLGSAMMVICIFILSSRDLFLDRGGLVGEQKLLVGTGSFIGAMGLFMVFPMIWQQFMIVKRNQIQPIHQIDNRIKAPQILTTDSNSTGGRDAPYTLVEFADYQCQHCAKASKYIADVLKQNPKKFRLVFRNYPLPMHTWANRAACAAEAAALQGKFWEMHDYIFNHQKDMEQPNFKQEAFKEYASAIGLDVEKFYTDMQSDQIIAKVTRDAVAAPRLNVKLTPTFFVIHGSKTPYQVSGMDQLQIAIDDPQNKVWE